MIKGLKMQPFSHHASCKSSQHDKITVGLSVKMNEMCPFNNTSVIPMYIKMDKNVTINLCSNCVVSVNILRIALNTADDYQVH